MFSLSKHYSFYFIFNCTKILRLHFFQVWQQCSMTHTIQLLTQQNVFSSHLVSVSLSTNQALAGLKKREKGEMCSTCDLFENSAPPTLSTIVWINRSVIFLGKSTFEWLAYSFLNQCQESVFLLLVNLEMKDCIAYFGLQGVAYASYQNALLQKLSCANSCV